MKSIDQLGRTCAFDAAPCRIVSLVPSQTELLVDIGLEEWIVGITKFCVHPKSIKNTATIVGGTKSVHYEKIKKLHPDIIIANKEENTKEMVEKLEGIATVWVSDIITIQDNNNMILEMGRIFSVERNAIELVDNINQELRDFKKFVADVPFKKVSYLIWKKPLMAVGSTTFIDSLLYLNRYQNIHMKSESRYPTTSLEELKEADLVLLSTEPFPFKKEHQIEIKNALDKEVRLVDGEYFSWYGSRLLQAFTYFKTLHQ